jgi:hypothetical protein
MARTQTVPKKGKVVKGKVPKVTKTTPLPNTMPDPCPLGASRVWNKVRPKEGLDAKSRISNFNDGGEKKYTQKPKFAPKVPDVPLTRKGYCGPNEKPTIKRGGSGDVGTADAYPAEAHTSYD